MVGFCLNCHRDAYAHGVVHLRTTPPDLRRKALAQKTFSAGDGSTSSPGQDVLSITHSVVRPLCDDLRAESGTDRYLHIDTVSLFYT